MLGRLISNLIGSGAAPEGGAPVDAAPSPAGNPLADYFFHNSGRLIDKWHHYFDIYHRHFARFRGRSPVVVEVGVYHGGSLQMWNHYFGPGVRIVGIDNNPRCRQFETGNTTILIGDQADRAFLAQVRAAVPRIDILIDDGGHRMAQQIATFEEIFPHIQPNGIYLCEDVHTSLIPEYDGGHRREGTFLEYGKALVDRLYGWYERDPGKLRPDEFTATTHGVHFYDSIVVVEKSPKAQPQSSKTGSPAF